MKVHDQKVESSEEPVEYVVISENIYNIEGFNERVSAHLRGGYRLAGPLSTCDNNSYTHLFQPMCK